MRPATAQDIPALVEMGRLFHANTAPKWALDEDGLASVLSALLSGGYVARTDGGFIAGVLCPNPIGQDWLIAKEFLWWATDGSGMKLRRGFREWAAASGAQEIQWSCPANDERVKRAYGRSAEPTEIIYSEYLPCA